MTFAEWLDKEIKDADERHAKYFKDCKFAEAHKANVEYRTLKKVKDKFNEYK